MLVFSTSLLASENGFECQKPKDDGTWWIPAEKFTKEEAEEAISELSALVKQGSAGRDFIEVENYLTMLRGYLYQDFLKTYKAEFNETDEQLQQEFCKFLQTKAFYHH